MIVHAENLVAGDVGPWGSTVIDVRPSHYDRERVLITWTGGAGPGLRGARPEDRRTTVRGRTDTVRIERPGPSRSAAHADLAAVGRMADPPTGPDRIAGRPFTAAAEDRLAARRAIADAAAERTRAERQRVYDAAIARFDVRDPRTGGRWTGD